MNILDQIVNYKRLELKENMSRVSLEQLKKSSLFERQTYSLSKILKTDLYGIIAEFKRASPSQKNINLKAEISKIGLAYAEGGAAGISVLTDNQFFKGSNEDLISLRSRVDIPILRKDFIFDSYQVYEAKAIGADLILLIAAILTPTQVQEFAKLAHKIGLEVLLEVHNLTEIRTHFEPNSKFVDILGVNNRNLKTFETSLQTALDLLKYIPNTTVCIAESGINSVQDLKILKKAGYHGCLIGTHFMKTTNPGQAFLNFSQKLEDD